jgi:Uncharacterised nucleotidyltransferase
MTLVSKWLRYLSDPQEPLTPRPQRQLDFVQALKLIQAAERHGTLPALVGRLELALQGSTFQAVKADAAERQRQAIAFNLMLRACARNLMKQVEAEQLPAVIVKGPVFAASLYPATRLRRFTDIDLLVDPSALSRINALLDADGFKLVETNVREWKWIARNNPLLVIEVQTDLVHAASLSPALSLTHADIAGDGVEESQRPSSLLVVAAVHGACHAFERLVHVIDVCQAARKLQDLGEERRLEMLMNRTGSRFAVVAALDLAARLFAEPRCVELAAAIGPIRNRRTAAALLTPSVVTSTMSRTRWLHSWRRNGFRELLKRTTHPSRDAFDNATRNS